MLQIQENGISELNVDAAQWGHIALFFPLDFKVKFTSLDVLTLCFSEKLPAASNLKVKESSEHILIEMSISNGVVSTSTIVNFTLKV